MATNVETERIARADQLAEPLGIGVDAPGDQLQKPVAADAGRGTVSALQTVALSSRAAGAAAAAAEPTAIGATAATNTTVSPVTKRERRMPFLPRCLRNHPGERSEPLSGRVSVRTRPLGSRL